MTRDPIRIIVQSFFLYFDWSNILDNLIGWASSLHNSNMNLLKKTSLTSFLRFELWSPLLSDVVKCIRQSDWLSLIYTIQAWIPSKTSLTSFLRFEFWPLLSDDNNMYSISLVKTNFFCLNASRWLVIFFVVRSISLWMERYK